MLTGKEEYSQLISEKLAYGAHDTIHKNEEITCKSNNKRTI